MKRYYELIQVVNDIYDAYYINNQGLYLSGGSNQPDSMELKPTRMNYEVGSDI